MRPRWTRLLRLGIGCLLALPTLALCVGRMNLPRVRTTQGWIAGTAAPDGTVARFLGVPYAAAPVGPLRWRAPRPHAPWAGVRSADHFGASCMQGPNTEFGPWTKEFLYGTPPSEDCLFLNLWTPRKSGAAKVPVLVFLHGGAFLSGSGDVPVYDGSALARTGLVVVTLNYRLGVFGFFAHPGLTMESRHHSSGDYGLLDQIAALRWVQQNIAAFGGDPHRVTIAGQSAGAFSVDLLLASPLAHGLFVAAIADSGIGGAGAPTRSKQQAEAAGAAFAASIHAPSVQALRAIPAAELLAESRSLGMPRPVVDGWVLPHSPLRMDTTRGLGNAVPVITGFQANDYRLAPMGRSASEYRQHAQQLYGPLASEFLELYPAATDAQVPAAEAASGRDRLRAGAYLWAIQRTDAGNPPVYVYYFDRAIPWPAHPEFGAFHTGEIPYAFGTLAKLNRPWQPFDRRVSAMMMGYWRNMAMTGDPNGSGLPRWSPARPAKAVVMRLGAEPGPMPVADAQRIDFWRRYFSSLQSRNAPPF